MPPITSEQTQWLQEKLKAIDFLTDLSEEEVNTLIQTITSLSVFAGQTIIRQGQKCGASYLVGSGDVDIWADTPKGRQKLATIGEGSLFGEISILTGDVCNATVSAKNDVQLFVVPAQGMQKLAQSNPNLASKIAERVANRKGVKALGLDLSNDLARSNLLSRVKSFLTKKI